MPSSESLILPYLRRRVGFTLVELLTVIAIVGILAAILISKVAGMKSRASTATAVSNLRQIAVALQMFIADNKGR